MQCYTELLPPTGVTHALTISFLSPSANNLVIAKTSLLQIFNVVDVKPRNDHRRASNASSEHLQTKLLLVAEYVLPGVITDLARVRLMESKSGGEALLISTRNAKLSLVEWDPESHGLSTISIHYYENEDANLNPWVPDISRCPTHLTVDPSYRCAVLHYCLNRIAVLPFRQPGDDLVMDDFDTEYRAGNVPERDEGEGGDGGEGGEEGGTITEKQKQDESTTAPTPYLPSFVLPLPALDPTLVHPQCLEFLNEYREPTLGVLYSQLLPSNNMSVERKDVMIYSIVTLDLEQHASTILVTVPKLPSDLFQIIPLPLPVGGALLLGANEVIHVDQAGKTNAVGVNEFSRLASSFPMADQSALGMRLENCKFEQLGKHNGDMLMMLQDGTTAILSFKLDGRSVSGMSIRAVSSAAGKELLSLAPTCTANIGNNMLFLGSEETDSLLVGFSKPLAKQRIKSDEDGDVSDASDKDEDEDEDMYEDDLYSSSPKDSAHMNGETVSDGTTGESYVFRELDRLQSLGPMTDITFGKPFKRDEKVDKSYNPLPELELLASQGRNGTGALTILRQKLDPEVNNTLKVQGAQAAWAVHVRDLKDTETQKSQEFAQYLILAISHDEGEQTVVHEIGESVPKVLKAPEFNPNNEKTIDIGVVGDGLRIVQVLGSEVRSYDSALELSQIYPVFDEDTSEERHAISVTFSDPYIAIIRDDQSLLLLQADKSGDLDEIPLESQVSNQKWLSASLYRDTCEFFIPKTTEDRINTFMILLGTEGQAHIFILPEPEKSICVIDGLDLLPPILPFTTPVRKTNLREELGELVVANLGDQIHHAPYFIILTALGDLVIYEPYHAPSNAPGSSYSIETLRLQKLSNQSLFDFFGTSQSSKPSSSGPRMCVLENVGGYKTVFIPGRAPRFIIKTATSAPHVVGLRGGDVRSLGEFHTSKCERGLIYMDDTEKGLVRMCHISPDVSLETSWATRRIQLDEEVVSICYSPAQDVYALGTIQTVGFKLPDDDEIHPEWQNEVLNFFLPRMKTGSVQLLETEQCLLIDEYVLEDPAERIMCVKCISMEVSEITGERKEMIVVGTAITKGEDVPARGCIYVFNVINVVPDFERPVRSRRLKLFAREKVKGAVTSISPVGDQGFIIVAQGQKCMVRGLKEDGSLLPVAFMDMQCYISTLKELKGTGLCIMADALRGLWFAGYSEEPYKLSLFSKDTDNRQVLHADFLPDGKRLYILASDDNCNLHIFQYDPEDPTSSNGDRLLHRSSFQTGHLTSTITLLPRAIDQTPAHEEGAADAKDDDSHTQTKSAAYQVLVTSTSGQMAAVTPLAEETYRRLSAIQSHLTITQKHPCGLNPRAFRAVQSDVTGGRGMIDGSLLRRYLDLAPQKKMEMASRAGADLWEIRTDLETISGTGLAYL
ncbi:mRNA cleavage and polyadenylation factor subunit [Ascosphaera aggregata]|nr:mRNA cleavage and polyadenylation factor subunit [Ascosphaera aggregata]